MDDSNLKNEKNTKMVKNIIHICSGMRYKNFIYKSINSVSLLFPLNKLLFSVSHQEIIMNVYVIYVSLNACMK